MISQVLEQHNGQTKRANSSLTVCLSVVGTLRIVDATGSAYLNKIAADSPLHLKGRLEVYYSGTWGSVCDDSFTDQAAGVACRSLGWSDGTVLHSACEGTPGSGPIWLDEVSCSGSEEHLSDCSHTGVGGHDCTHLKDVTVTCQGEPSDQF